MPRLFPALATLGILLTATASRAADITVEFQNGDLTAFTTSSSGPCGLTVRPLVEKGEFQPKLVFVPSEGTTINGEAEEYVTDYPGERNDLLIDLRGVPDSFVVLTDVNFLHDGAGNHNVGDDIVIESDGEAWLFRCSTGWTRHGTIEVHSPYVRMQDVMADTEIRVSPYRGSLFRDMVVKMERCHAGYGDDGDIHIIGTASSDYFEVKYTTASSRIETVPLAGDDDVYCYDLKTPLLKCHMGSGARDHLYVFETKEVGAYDLHGGQGDHDALHCNSYAEGFNPWTSPGFEWFFNV